MNLNMSLEFVFVWMLFMHILDDFRLQGIMAEMKQKSWWEKQDGYNVFYKWDYIPALICHSLGWSFMIMLPIAVYYGFNVNGVFIFTFFINAMWHAVMDNTKANLKTTNLVIDQLFHLLQIVATFAFYPLYVG